MSIVDAAILFVAGFLSGVVNAIAGGGTFLTFGAMTLTGLPPIAPAGIITAACGQPTTSPLAKMTMAMPATTMARKFFSAFSRW